MAAYELKCIETGTDGPHNGTSPIRLLIYSVSFPTNSNEINLDSIVDLVMQVCFTD